MTTFMAMSAGNNWAPLQKLPEQKLATESDEVPLNAIRVFVTIAREGSVTRAAHALGMTQSSVSRYLAVLQHYLGTDLIERRGRRSELTEFGRLFANTVAEPLDTVCFTAKRMRSRIQPDANRIVVRTSLSTFAYTFLIPNLHAFSAETNGVIVDVISSPSQPTSSDNYDVLITRDLSLVEPADDWNSTMSNSSDQRIGARWYRLSDYDRDSLVIWNGRSSDMMARLSAEESACGECRC